MSTATTWLQAHSYNVKSDRGGGIVATMGQTIVAIHAPADGQIATEVTCVRGPLELLGLEADCENERYRVLYDITQAINASPRPPE